MSSPFPRSSPPPEVNSRKRGYDEDDNDDIDMDQGVPSSQYRIEISLVFHFLTFCSTRRTSLDTKQLPLLSAAN